MRHLTSVDNIKSQTKLFRKKDKSVKRNYPFSLKDFRNNLNKKDDDIKAQREEYIKSLSKQNQFLSQKYINDIKSDLENKITQKRFKKNIKYSKASNGRNNTQSNVMVLKTTTDKSKQLFSNLNHSKFRIG